MICKDAKLFEQNEISYLEFRIDEETKCTINLNSEDQTQLREMFYKIIEKCFSEEFEFRLVVEENYSKDLYKEISEEYIKQLNKEIVKVKESIPEIIKENKI